MKAALTAQGKGNRTMKKIISLIMAAVMLLSLAACSSAPSSSQEPEPVEKIDINLGLLKGPTGMGAVELLDLNEKGEAANNYNFTLFSSPTDITAKIISGELDIAAVPSNLASTLYNKTQGGVTVLAVNTIGTLYIVEAGDSVHSLEDLAGKTIVAAGQGATPEYALDYVLTTAGLKDSVTVEWVPEHAEVVAKLAAGEARLGLIPEPNVTSALLQNADARIAINMSDEWDKAAEANGSPSRLVMGCVIANSKFVEEHPENVAAFLREYEESIGFVNANVDEAARLCEHFEIIPKAAVAKKAIPSSGIVYLDGAEMRDALEAFLGVLYSYNPQIVGGNMPDDPFYYAG